jgi:hypothetical protein
MKSIKAVIVTYLAIYGFLMIAPFFLALVSIPALIVLSILRRFNVSEDVSNGASFIMVFISIYVFFQIYSAVKFRRMEHDLEKLEQK